MGANTVASCSIDNVSFSCQAQAACCRTNIEWFGKTPVGLLTTSVRCELYGHMLSNGKKGDGVSFVLHCNPRTDKALLF